MEIRLYSNFQKRHNSTKRPSGNYSTRNVELKQSTSRQTPTFLLSGDDTNYNYVYVPQWNRYYYITNINKGNTNLFEINCNIDVLATYKDDISNYTCYIERCASTSYINNQIYDSALTATENVVDVASATTNLFGTGGVFICRVLNSSYGVTTYIGGLDTFSGLFDPTIADYDSFVEKIKAVIQFYISDPASYVSDIYFLGIPLGEIPSNKYTEAPLGSGWYAAGSCYKWTGSSPIINSGNITLNKPTIRYSDWRQSSPAFTQYSMYLPSLGEVPLSGDLINTTLQIQAVVDIYTGELVYILKSTDSHGDTSTVATYKGNIKSGLMTGSTMPTAAGIITSSLGMAGAIASGNPLAIGSATLNVVQNTITPTPSIIGSSGSCAGILAESDIIITRLSKDCGDSPNTVGQPCCKNVKIGNLSGYIKTAGASINIAGFESDKTAINAFLDGGFYYE